MERESKEEIEGDVVGGAMVVPRRPVHKMR